MRTTLFASLIVLFGCNAGMQSDGPPGAVTLDVEPWTVSAGESVVLTLWNGSSGSVGYNLCTSSLERQEGTAWSPVPSDRACTMELRTLDAGERADYTFELPSTLAAGEYRFRTTVHMLEDEAQREVVSDEVTVRSSD